MKNFYQLKSFSAIFILTLLSFTITSCKTDTKGVIPTISQTVVGLADFSQLELSAVKSNVVVALSNKNTAVGSNGDYTVFAPTNKAFAKLGLATGADLNALQTPFLKDIVNYHISNGRSKDEQLPNQTIVLSLSAEQKLIVTRPNGDKFVNGSKIIATDIKADNGVVHAIDRVLLASGTDIANTAIFFSEGKGFVKPELTFLVAAVIYCDLVTTLSDGTKSYTVFAPTDQAFKDLGQKLGVALNQPSDVTKLDKATLTNILKNHILATNAYFTSQLYGGSLLTKSGKNITLGEYEDGYLSVKGAGNSTVANMVIPDIKTTNGVVHVIDRVLLP